MQLVKHTLFSPLLGGDASVRPVGRMAEGVMHVASWRIAAEPDWTFVTSDKNQLNVVAQLNYKTIAV